MGGRLGLLCEASAAAGQADRTSSRPEGGPAAAASRAVDITPGASEKLTHASGSRFAGVGEDSRRPVGALSEWGARAEPVGV